MRLRARAYAQPRWRPGPPLLWLNETAAFLVRSEFARFGQIGVRARFVARGLLRGAAIAERVGIFRIQLNRFIEIGDGFGVELQLQVGESARVVSQRQ